MGKEHILIAVALMSRLSPLRVPPRVPFQ